MKRLLIAGLMFGASCMPLSAQTANLVAGEVQQAVVLASGSSGASCYVGRGAAFFQRNATAKLAYISFAEISGEPYRDLSGQATLSFATAAAGSIRFRYDKAIVSVPFTSYVQSYDAAAHRLTVRFNIHFVGCNLPIMAFFEGA